VEKGGTPQERGEEKEKREQEVGMEGRGIFGHIQAEILRKHDVTDRKDKEKRCLREEVEVRLERQTNMQKGREIVHPLQLSSVCFCVCVLYLEQQII